MPPPEGEFRLYSSVRPALSAGRHRLRMTQTIDKASGPIAPVDRYVDVDAPRLRLPRGELLSVFPPPNAEGAFSTRLAQVVLRRRTLPWERNPGTGPAANAPPWLALVVLADDEADFLPNVPVAEALPAAVRSGLGIAEDAVCDALHVSRRVVDQVFPREDELDLLCHVREVDVADTEFAGGDDDGFVAVLMSHRLPRPGVRYTAYLVSIEGQLAELPDPAPSQDSLGPASVYELSPELLELYERQRFGIHGGRIDRRVGTVFHEPVATGSGWTGAGPSGGGEAPRAFTAVQTVDSFVDHHADFAVLERLVGGFFDPANDLLRFPVLAHWSFACEGVQGEGGGDFQSRMRDLDVGMLGTVAPADTEHVQVAPTGHTVIAHGSRRGEDSQAWYRGPLAPRQVRRREAPAPLHAADQARRLAEDGMIDLSEAAAFEVGRLLALSDRAFLASLSSWRRSGFLMRRKAKQSDELLGSAMADRVWIDRLVGLADMRAEILGPPVPVVDIADLLSDVDAGVIAEGLGLPQDLVAESLGLGPAGAGLDPGGVGTITQPGFDGLLREPQALDFLIATLNDVAGRLRAAAAARPEGFR